MNAYHLFTVYKGLPAVRGAALSYFFQKLLALEEIILYTMKCCDMIAMKREVATVLVGFPWSECQEAGDQRFRSRNLTASHCTVT